VARYGQAFKDKAVARLLPPESAAVEAVAQELGVAAATGRRQLSWPACCLTWRCYRYEVVVVSLLVIFLSSGGCGGRSAPALP